MAQLSRFIAREVPSNAPLLVAGDFNDWSSRVPQTFARFGLHAWEGGTQPTFPSRLPLAQLDHVFGRGLQPVGLSVPRGQIWARMSDHLPLIAEFGLPE
jgi:endonuclease/exonuclease/phosphatase family metal-dependent hydrolase